MKGKLLLCSTVFLVAFAFVFQINLNSQYKSGLSAISLKNIEALAQNESSSHYAEIECASTIITASDGTVLYVTLKKCIGDGTRTCDC